MTDRAGGRSPTVSHTKPTGPVPIAPGRSEVPAPLRAALEYIAADAQAAPTQRSVMPSGTSRHEGGTGA
jgi:hypothetical protein